MKYGQVGQVEGYKMSVMQQEFVKDQNSYC